MKKGFTLAETMVTIVILGIIAVIVVPNLINRQVENANRTKVKKAMAAYEKILNLMVIENDLKSNDMIAEFGQEEGVNGEKCGYTRPYFKTVKNGSDNCKFKAPDGLWWDITDISKPIISFKEENLTAEQASSEKYTAFYMYGLYDDQDILRINENGYEIVQKVFQPSSFGINIYNHNLKIWQYLGNDGEYKKLNYTSMLDCNATSCKISEYDENGRVKILYYSCNLNGKNCQNSQIKEYDSNGNNIWTYWGCDGNGKNCQHIQYYEYDEYGNRTIGGICNLNKQNCKKYYIFTHDENNNETAWYYTCSNNNISSCKNVYKYFYNEKNQLIEYYTTQDNKTEKYEYDDNGTRTAKYECDINGNNCKGPYSYRYE